MISYSLISLVLALALAYQLLRNRAQQRLLPGPTPFPVIGNIFDVPKETAWLKYTHWKKRYGDVVYLNMLGTPVVFLNSLKACNDLLDKRSAIYSGRPRAVMLSEVVGWDFNFVLFDYTSRWRRHRRLFRQQFSETASREHRPVEERSVHDLLGRLLGNNPDELSSHIRFSVSKTVLEAVYGIQVKDHSNPFLINAERAATEIFQSCRPGQFLVDVFPFLKDVPLWMPGAGFKRRALEWNRITQESRDKPFNHVKESIERGTAAPSVLSSLLSQYENDLNKRANQNPASGDDAETVQDSIKSTTSVAHVAGAETTTVALQTFFLVMANHSEVQSTAQSELDRVVGNDRLPAFQDKDSLPYITAVIKEIFRLHTVVPLGFPHSLTEHDIYEGYRIPKGAIVVPNVWAILHDEEVYPDANSFKPSRWLMQTDEGMKISPSVPDSDIIFGFGRRICPGMHFAGDSIFLAVASVLACFNIKPLDTHGKPGNRVPEQFEDIGVSMAPVPFKVALVPRSEKAATLIKEAAIMRA